MAEKTSTRRSLRFDRIDQVLADIDSLAEAETNGTARCLGNWTFGQNLNHLATWVDYAYEGLPYKIPFVIRCVARPLKKRILTKPMKPGMRLPNTSGGTLATEVVATDEALSHLRKTLARLACECPVRPHPMFGPMHHDEWIALHLRHAELHLSFISPS